MYLTVKNQLRNYSVREYEILRKLCRLSKNLYNEALYSVRKYFFAERKYLRYENNYYVCKTSENYRALNTDVAQQTLKVVDRCFKSFFALISKAKSGSYQFNQISLPHYLDKEGYFSLIIPPEISVNLDYDKYLAVDLGLDNLASCVTSEGASFIGKQIKFYNRLYNKENAKLQSILAKQQIKYFSKRQYLNLQKRNA
ncbi:MAG: transposase, partial [Synergistaceae bacterium]|nr:transposase [Synergistaceae bacterium]